MKVLQAKLLWDEISALSSECNHRQCAVAYVTDTTSVAFSDGDILIVDASDESIMAGSTSASELEKLFRLGVELYCCQNLHAKIYLLDNWLVIGSCNLSLKSRSLIEAGLVTDNPEAIQGAQSILQETKEKSLRIDMAFIQRIMQLPVRVSELSSNESVVLPTHFWRLSTLPVAITNDMKCYLHALITVQIGTLKSGCEFYLWSGPRGSESFRAHMWEELGDNERLIKVGEKYVLTEQGVVYFTKRKLDMDKVECFRRAIISGDGTQLPDTITISEREMVRLF